MTKMFVAAVLAFSVPVLASAQPLALKLDHLNRLSSQAKETVDVTVDAGLLQLAAAFIPEKAGGAEAAAVKALIAGLKGIYVKSFEFDRDGGYADTDVETVRAQLKAPWSRMVNVDNRESREHVEVYIWRDGDQPGGLAVLVAQPRELTIVNIVGRINLAQLANLRGVLGIPDVVGTIPGVTKP